MAAKSGRNYNSEPLVRLSGSENSDKEEGVRPLADVLWSERTRDEFPPLAARGGIVIVPIASTEQHGQHLPVDTDCRTVEYVAQRAARLVETVPVLVTRPIPFGVSPHHMVFPGTISLRVETVLHLLEDVCGSIVAHGFERLLILSGHGGNGSTIAAAALELRHRLGRQIHAHSWFDLIPDVIRQTREGPCENIGHAGEMETSCILALAPGSVRQDKYALVPGITDQPSRGAAAKGEKVLNAAADAVAALLLRLAEQGGREIVGIETIRE